MPEQKEQRGHPRVDLLAQVQVTRDSEIYVMAAASISRGGVFIQGDPAECPDLTPGAAVELVIFATEDLGVDEAHAEARIVRVVQAGSRFPPGFGLQLINLAPAQAQLLERLVKAAAL